MKRDKELENNPEFREYRRKMHQSLVNPDDNPVTREEEACAETGRKPTLMQYLFGAFMIVVYVGMGILLMIGFFGEPTNLLWKICNYVVGVILVIYGIWRAIRLVFGLDTRL